MVIDRSDNSTYICERIITLVPVVKTIYNPAIFEIDIGIVWPELFDKSDTWIAEYTVYLK
jgi:hypothetical protein